VTAACYIPVALGSYVSFSAQNEARRRRFTLTCCLNFPTSLYRLKKLESLLYILYSKLVPEQSCSNYQITPAMRLINIKTYQLESFDNWETVPPYAIMAEYSYILTQNDYVIWFYTFTFELIKSI
jgi:hypothetical protein